MISLEDLAGRGAKVVLAVRDLVAAEDVVSEIKQRYSYADLVSILYTLFHKLIIINIYLLRMLSRLIYFP